MYSVFRGIGVFVVLFFVALPVRPISAQVGKLENPFNGSRQSGIGIISGWHCTATRIEVQFDDRPRMRAAYGSTRADTAPTCGDWYNGFVLQYNFGQLGDGYHLARVFADGVQFGSTGFFVTTLGTNFIRGVEGVYTLPDFPYAGDQTVIQWNQAAQNFTITDYSGTAPTDPFIGTAWRGNLTYTSSGYTCKWVLTARFNTVTAGRVDYILTFDNTPSGFSCAGGTGWNFTYSITGNTLTIRAIEPPGVDLIGSNIYVLDITNAAQGWILLDQDDWESGVFYHREGVFYRQ